MLFASVVGAGDIEPAVLEVATGATGTSGRLESSTVAMRVLPLPAPEPEGFTGAVGRFEGIRLSGCRRGQGSTSRCY